MKISDILRKLNMQHRDAESSGREDNPECGVTSVGDAARSQSASSEENVECDATRSQFVSDGAVHSQSAVDVEIPSVSETVARLKRNLMVTAIVLSLTVVFMAAVTIAWFASNKNVNASQSQVSAGTVTDALYISNTGTEDYKTETTATISDDRGLFPISTADGVHWYYPTAWELKKDESDPLGASMMATGYTEAECTIDATGVVGSYTATGEHAGTGDDGSGSGSTGNAGSGDGASSGTGAGSGTSANIRTAYYKQSYIIYSGEGNYDIYLEPSGTISVDYATGVEADTAQKAKADTLKSAIRIAITKVTPATETTEASETLVFYYIPEPESGTGNSYVAGSGSSDSSYAVADQAYAIYPPADASGSPYISTITSYSMDDYTASLIGVQKYNAGNKSFGRAGGGLANGLRLNVYVWLEGTDAQTMLGETTAIPAVLNVKLAFAGVEAND